MTRREKEIHKASISWKDEVIIVKEEKAFVAGAKWADKTMLEKVEKWLRINNRGQLIGSLNRFLKEK